MAAVLALDSMSLNSWPEPALPMDIQPLKQWATLVNPVKVPCRNHLLGGPSHGANLRPAVATRSIQGRRAYQEDAYAIVTDLLGAASPPCSGTAAPAAPQNECLQSDGLGSLPVLHYAAVFDGHGGSAVSHHCTERLVLSLRSRLMRTLRKPCGLLQSDSSTDSLTDEQLFGTLQQLQQTDNIPAISHDSSGELQQSCGSAEAVAAGLAVAGLSNEDARDCLLRSFADCDASIPEAASAEGGSTAVCALVGTDNIWVANCGDSRAVLARRGAVTIALTDDHKPERPDEAARVKAAGGHVFWNGGHRVMGVLSMSRAMGDQYLKQFGVIATPEITCIERTPEDEFLLLASDGLWMSLTNVDAVGVAAACIERAQARGADRQAALRVAAQVLVKAALQQGSSDNITVVLMDLQGASTSTAPAPVTAESGPTAAAPQGSSPMELENVAQVQQPAELAAEPPTTPDQTSAPAHPADQLGQLELSPIAQPSPSSLPKHVALEIVTQVTVPPAPARSGSKRVCDSEVEEGEHGSQEVVSPTKRSRLAQQRPAFCAPLLNLSTERLLVSVPSPTVSPRDS